MTPAEHPFRLDALLEESTWLQGVARALTQQDADRDDLVQETWLAALRNRGARVEHRKGWLATVARRTAGVRRRSRRRREDHESLAVGAAADASAGPLDPKVSMERLELASLLAAELAMLPEPYRTDLYMRYYEGLAPAAIAARLGITASTLRGRLHRGRALLREALVARDGQSWDTWAALLLPIGGAPALATSAPGGLAIGTMMTMKWTVVSVLVGALAAGGSWWAESMSSGEAMGEVPAEMGSRGQPALARTESSLLRAPESAGRRELAESEARPSPPSSPDPIFGILGRGVIVDGAGRPIDGATVQVRTAGQDPVSATTGPSGGWSMMDIVPGPAQLEVSAPGFLSVTSSVEVEVRAGWNMSVTLRRAGILPVRFEDPEGEALAVRSFSPGPGAALGVAVTHGPPGARLDAGGRFLKRSEAATFESRAEDELPPDWGSRYQGRLLLMAVPPLWVSLTYRDAVVETRRLVGGEEELVFVVGDLKPFSGTVTLRAVDEVTGASIVTGMTLSHPSGSRAIEPRVQDGQLIFEAIPPGRFSISHRASPNGRLSLNPDEDPRVGPGETLDLGVVRVPGAER